MYLGQVSGTEFEKAYNELANSEDKRPIASTIIPAFTQGSKPVFEAWIFYELKAQDPRTINKENGKVEPKPVMKMEM